MSQKRSYEIEIKGIKQAVQDTESLSKAFEGLQKGTKSAEQASKEYQKALREQTALEKAEETIANGQAETYAEKQKLLTALGRVIKNLNESDAEQAKRQKELIQQYAALNAELKAFDKTMGNNQRSVGDYTMASRDLKTELRQLQEEMANLLANGVDKNSQQFKELASKAGSIQDALGDAREEISRFASDTKKLDDAINIAQSLTSVFGIMQGAMSTLGIESEETVKAIQKLQGIQTLIASFKTLSETLQTGSASAKIFQAAMKATTVTIEGSTVASKALTAAMRAIPLLLIISLITELATRWKDITGWVDKSVPSLNKFGGVLGIIKGSLQAVGKAIINWLINPFKTATEVISALFKGDFSGALEAAKRGIVNQFQGTVEEFKKGWKEGVDSGIDYQNKKIAENNIKELNDQMELLKAKKGNDVKYTNEYITLQKKAFEQRKIAAKGNEDELKQIQLDELNYFREIEENKQKIQKETSDKAKQQAEELKKRLKELRDSQISVMNSTFGLEESELKSQEAFFTSLSKMLEKRGDIEGFKDAMQSVLEVQREIANANFEKNWTSWYQMFTNNVQDTDIETFKKNMQDIISGKAVDEVFSNLSDTQKNYLQTLINNIKAAQNDLQMQLNVLNEQTKEAVLNALNGSIQGEMELVKTQINDVLQEMGENKDKNPSIWQKIFSPKKFRETIEKNKAVLNSQKEDVNIHIKVLSDYWDRYLENIKKVYGEDSIEFRKALNTKNKDIEDFANKASSATKSKGLSQYTDELGNTDWNKILEMPFEDSVDLLYQNIITPAMTMFSDLFDYEVEEAQKAVDRITEEYERVASEVEESRKKIDELNREGSLSNTQMIADEMQMLRERQAEEERLAEEKARAEKELEKKEKQQRKLQLAGNLVDAISNNALAITKTYSMFGFPLGAAFAAVMAALGAVQVGIISKQMSKLAEGGLIEGKSHDAGGIQIGNTGIEVEGGEFVTNKKSTSKYSNVLKAINSDLPSVNNLSNAYNPNFAAMDNTLQNNDQMSSLIKEIRSIDFSPTVSVVDINRGQRNLTRVRELSGMNV